MLTNLLNRNPCRVVHWSFIVYTMHSLNPGYYPWNASYQISSSFSIIEWRLSFSAIFSTCWNKFAVQIFSTKVSLPSYSHDLWTSIFSWILGRKCWIFRPVYYHHISFPLYFQTIQGLWRLSAHSFNIQAKTNLTVLPVFSIGIGTHEIFILSYLTLCLSVQLRYPWSS